MREFLISLVLVTLVLCSRMMDAGEPVHTNGPTLTEIELKDLKDLQTVGGLSYTAGANYSDIIVKFGGVEIKNYTNVVWNFSSTNVLKFQVYTNLSTNWVVVRTNETTQWQQGYILTNRMLSFGYRDAVAPITLDVLGQTEWPDLKRTVPSRHAR